MKIVEVVEKARRDKKYAERLRRLGADAAKFGTTSAAWAELLEEFVETPSDLRALSVPRAYPMMLSAVDSTNPVTCLIPPPDRIQTNIALDAAPRRAGTVAKVVTGRSSAKRTATKGTPARRASR